MLAALGSFIFAGLGQVYNGQPGKAVGVFLLTILGAMAFLVPGVIMWLYGVADAYLTATKMNEGKVPFRNHSWLQIIAFIIFCMIIGYTLYSLLTVLMMTMIESGEFSDLLVSY